MRIAPLVCLLLAVATAAPAQRLVSDRPDHTLLVSIEADRPGAQLWTVRTNGDAAAVADLPFVVPVQFRWHTGWFRKRWDRLQVSTVGDLCQTTYDKKTKRWTVAFLAEVRAPGAEPQRIERELATFTKPDDLDWDRIHFLPDRLALPVSLATTPAGAAAKPTAARAPATVMLAGDKPGAAGRFGTVILDASVAEAEVIVDGAPAGRTPVRLILREGKHEVTVQKAGHRALQQELTVSPESEVRLKVTLEPAS